jgi:hypothetical protein
MPNDEISKTDETLFQLESLAQVAHDTFFADRYKDQPEIDKDMWRNVVMAVTERMIELGMLEQVKRISGGTTKEEDSHIDHGQPLMPSEHDSSG